MTITADSNNSIVIPLQQGLRRVVVVALGADAKILSSFHYNKD